MNIQPRAPDYDHLRWLERAQLKDWNGKRIIDLGCGSGYLCEWLLEKGASRVVGVDIEPPREISDLTKIPWIFAQTDLERPDWEHTLTSAFEGAAVDYIFAFDIIEHLTSPWRFLSSCHRLLRPGGRLVLTTPNTSSWERLAKPETWSGATDPQHKVLFNKYGLGFALKRTNFKIERLEAPLRSAKSLATFFPDIGGQLFSISQKSERFETVVDTKEAHCPRLN